MLAPGSHLTGVSMLRWASRWIAAIGFVATGACAQPAAPAEPSDAMTRALQRASDAVVGVLVQAVDDARSASTLGLARQGSGVVISDDGLVLTIGYLILEAEQVQIVTDDARIVPARVIAYDLASGFGLVRALVPLKLDPAPMGQAMQVATDDLLMVASGGAGGAISAARLLSRRGFSGYWEYHIDGALFTSPPRRDHSGAGLFNQRGELVGIGSLFVTDALGRDAPRTAGNMFVPIDLLAPILPELMARGSSQQSHRAWLGVNCIDQGNVVKVVRISEDSPADVAGLEAGDTIVRIDGVPVQTLEALWKTLWKTPPAERAVVIDILRDGQPQTVTVQAVDRAKTLRRPRGV
ncbi:MAG: serine protease [Rubrivivax sp.]|nr:serine protease [Rubrivivax sp.]